MYFFIVLYLTYFIVLYLNYFGFLNISLLGCLLGHQVPMIQMSKKSQISVAMGILNFVLLNLVFWGGGEG